MLPSIVSRKKIYPQLNLNLKSELRLKFFLKDFVNIFPPVSKFIFNPVNFRFVFRDVNRIIMTYSFGQKRLRKPENVYIMAFLSKYY